MSVGGVRLGMLWLLLIGLLFTGVVAAEEDLCAIKSLRAGVLLESFPYLSRNEAEMGLKFWAEEIGKAEGVEVTIDSYQDFNVLAKDFKSCKINFIAAYPWIIATKIDRSLLTDGFRIIKSGKSTDKLMLVVRKNEGISQLKDLLKKKIGIMKNDYIAETYLDILTLNEFGKPYTIALPKLVYEPKKSQLLFDLFFKKVDAVVINQGNFLIASELNPQIQEQTQVIYHFSNIYNSTGYFNIAVPQDFREHVIKTVVSLGGSVRDQQLLNIFEADRFERSTVTDLKVLDELHLKHQFLKNKFLAK